MPRNVSQSKATLLHIFALLTSLLVSCEEGGGGRGGGGEGQGGGRGGGGGGCSYTLNQSCFSEIRPQSALGLATFQKRGNSSW